MLARRRGWPTPAARGSGNRLKGGVSQPRGPVSRAEDGSREHARGGRRGRPGSRPGPRGQAGPTPSRRRDPMAGQAEPLPGQPTVRAVRRSSPPAGTCRGRPGAGSRRRSRRLARARRRRRALVPQVGQGAPVLPPRFVGRWPPLIAGVPCVAAVVTYGEFSTGALTAVGATGAVLAGVGLVRRVGQAPRPSRGALCPGCCG